MIGRLFSLALGLALALFAVLILKPELFQGYAQQPALGPYEAWHDPIGLTVGFFGLVILLAAILRKGETKTRKAASEPAALHLDDEAAVEPSQRSGAAVASPLW